MSKSDLAANVDTSLSKSYTVSMSGRLNGKNGYRRTWRVRNKYKNYKVTQKEYKRCRIGGITRITSTGKTATATVKKPSGLDWSYSEKIMIKQ